MTDRSKAASRKVAVATGALSGLVAALMLTFLQAVARLSLGISPPTELIGDRVAPRLSIALFFSMLDFFGGYDQLKQFGVGSATLGQLAIGLVIGAVYGLLSWRAGRDGVEPGESRHRRPFLFLLAMVAVWSLASLAVLWPVLATSYRGWSPLTARVVTILFMVVSSTVFAGVLWFRVPAHRRPLGHLRRCRKHRRRGEREPPLARRRRRGCRAGGGHRRGGHCAVPALDVQLRRHAAGRSGDPTHHARRPVLRRHQERHRPTRRPVELAARDHRPGRSTPHLRPRRAALDDSCRPGDDAVLHQQPPVGGGLQSNAMWTGVPLAELLAEAGPGDGVVEVLITSVDNYTDTFSIEKAMEPTTLVAYEMNGEPLPQRHGFPARILVPGLFGEKNVKWVTTVELVASNAKGFYEQQGWGPEFVVPTQSRFTEPDLAQPLTLGTVAVLRGTAFAGDRGVAGVEVSVDDGRTWEAAELEYSRSALAWVLWRYGLAPRSARRRSPPRARHRQVGRSADRRGSRCRSPGSDRPPPGDRAGPALVSRQFMGLTPMQHQLQLAVRGNADSR